MSTQASAGNAGTQQGSAKGQVYVTLSGLPVSIELEWPFRRSTSGGDFYVLHGQVRLENSGGLHALVAVQLTQTVREVLPSLEPREVEAQVINALRKQVDSKDLEFVKSPKRLPAPFSSRHYDLKRQKWAFSEATDEERLEYLKRKLYWQTKLVSAASRVGVADPIDVLYLNTTAEHMVELARKLAEEGLLKLEGEHAAATEALLAQAEKIEGDMRAAVRELEKKHAFERG